MATASKSSFELIIEALGGVSKTARAIDRSPSQICQWRQRYGQFPSEVYFIVRRALKRQGLNCPRGAFRFDDVRKRSKAG